MPDLLPITLDDMIQEAERELALRQRVYPRWVADHRLTQERADRQLDLMAAICGALSNMREVPAMTS